MEVHNTLEQSYGENYELWSQDCGWPYSDTRQFRLDQALTLERLSITYMHQGWNLRLGKQALNWGSARFIQPSDVVPENRLAEPWLERSGHWAARLDVSIGSDDDASIAVLESQEQPLGVLRWQRRWSALDVALVSIHRAEDSRFAIDSKGDLGLFSLWLESSFQVAHGPQPAWWRSLKSSAGVDTSVLLLDGWYFGTQLSYDGSGETDPGYYDWMARWPDHLWPDPCPDAPFPDQPDFRQTLGRWYGLLFSELKLTPELRINGAGLLNLSDRSALWFSSVEWWVNDSVSWTNGLRFSAGEGEFMSTQLGQPQLPQWTALSWMHWRI